MIILVNIGIIQTYSMVKMVTKLVHDKHHDTNDDDVDPEGGGHGDAAGHVAHSPLLGEL